MIEWQPIADMPEDRKDGRLLLVAVTYGDGSHHFYIGQWKPEVGDYKFSLGRTEYGPGFETTETTHDQCAWCVLERDASHWADINLPEESV